MAAITNLLERKTIISSSPEKVLDSYEVKPEQGLNKQAVQSRREEFGPNRLREAKSKSAWEILIDQLKSLIVLLLVVAAALAFGFGDIIEGFAIVAVIVINTLIGFFTELRAVRSMEALRELGHVSARVRRNGEVQEIHAEDLVPGDIVLLEGGDVVTADIRLFEVSKLQADESALTGESVPVSKQVDTIEGEAELAEQKNMVFKGTAITRGSGEGVVVAIGMETELGHISSLVEEAEEEETPLEKRLDQLGQRLVWLTGVVAVLVVVGGVISGKSLMLMVETAIALAVASIPEGLPIVATIALARGMQRMAKNNALINRLSAVETLGATNVICTDKTGTLTENDMTVSRIRLAEGMVYVGRRDEETFMLNDEIISPEEHDVLRDALRVGVFCNNATFSQEKDQAIGEPLETALLEAGMKAEMTRAELLKEMPEEREVAFDPENKMMATFHQHDSNFYVAVKGAPEAVLEVCSRLRAADGTQEVDDSVREEWSKRNEEMAADGLRMLALAERTADSVEEEPYQNLTFLGLVGLVDPPRKDVPDSIAACQSAGIKMVMVTGDQPATARNIGMAVGLVKEDEMDVVRGKELKPIDELSEEERQRMLRTPIFARVNPAQKLDLIAVHQNNGARVAMTGDGVNDAPALKKADIGIAMGQRGTQVAREAADMVLRDDALSSIVLAVKQGRIIFANIRKFVLYLLSCNLSEILVVGLASTVNAPLPIRPLQILFLNLVTDVFPALALGVGEGEERVMERPPRDPDEPVMTRQHWQTMGVYSSFITIAVLVAFALSFTWLDFDEPGAVTVAFLTLAFGQLFHVFNMRDSKAGILRNDVTRNPFVWGAVALSAFLLLLAVYAPILSDVLGTVNPGLSGWALVMVMSLTPLVAGQIFHLVRASISDDDE